MRIPVAYGEPRVLPVWVGVSGYSRWIVARMIPSREAHDILAAHWACLLALGGVPRLGVYDNEGAIGRHRGGRAELSNTFNTTDVRPVEGAIPSAYVLHQNYPNPFNPTTTIKYELPHSSVVRLSVFDVLGHEVSVLVNEREAAGVHEVKFDGTSLASGVYFYRLQAGDFTQTRRLLLLK